MFPNVRTLDTNYIKFVFIASHILTPKDFKKWNLLHVTHLSMKPAKMS